MPRKLPWAKVDSAPAKSPANPKVEPGYKAFRQRRDFAVTERANSSSPPSSPAVAAPPIQYMLPGDDAWLMVEDEFYATAQDFTKHLHHAEYKRLMELAKQNAAQGFRGEMAVRPTSGLPSKAVAETHGRSNKRRKIDDLVDRLGGGDTTAQMAQDELEEDEDDLIIEDRNLAGLMFANDVCELPSTVSSLAGPRPNTRAAAGLGRQGTTNQAMASKGHRKSLQYSTRDSSLPNDDDDDSNVDDDNDDGDLDLDVILSKDKRPSRRAPESNPPSSPPVTAQDHSPDVSPVWENDDAFDWDGPMLKTATRSLLDRKSGGRNPQNHGGAVEKASHSVPTVDLNDIPMF